MITIAGILVAVVICLFLFLPLLIMALGVIVTMLSPIIAWFVGQWIKHEDNRHKL